MPGSFDACLRVAPIFPRWPVHGAPFASVKREYVNDIPAMDDTTVCHYLTERRSGRAARRPRIQSQPNSLTSVRLAFPQLCSPLPSVCALPTQSSHSLPLIRNSFCFLLPSFDALPRLRRSIVSWPLPAAAGPSRAPPACRWWASWSRARRTHSHPVCTPSFTPFVPVPGSCEADRAQSRRRRHRRCAT